MPRLLDPSARTPARTAVVAATAALAVLAVLAPAARADSTASLVNGQRITGSVPPGEVIRVQFKAAAGSEPRLDLGLAGSRITLSFPRVRIIDPDDAVVPDTSRFFDGTRLRPGKSTLRLRDFIAQKTGIYTVVIETNSGHLPGITTLAASGRFRLKRPRREHFDVDEGDPTLGIALLYRDGFKVKVKRVEGGVPTILRMAGPDDGFGNPTQEFVYPQTERRRNKRGATSQNFRSIDDDVHTFDFGFRDGATTGSFVATARVSMFRVSTAVPLRLENAPGIDLSVRPANRFLSVEWGTGVPGIAYDAFTSSLLVSARYLGPTGPQIAGRLYDMDLGPRIGTPNPVLFVGPADMQPGEQVASHRLVGTDVNYYVAWATQTGAFAGFSRIRVNDLGREGYVEIQAGATPVQDPFLVTDGTRISLGLYRSPDGHDVHIYEADLTPYLTIGIGGTGLAHSNGAGAAWDEENERFELWAPDTLQFGLPSDLHRQFYSANWQSLGSDEKPIAGPLEQETMSSAVSIDPITGVTIVHYVVPENVTGAGEIRRALFDADGVLVPGSDQALFGTGRNRPTSLIVGSGLYLAYESTSGPMIERFPLLR